MKKKIIFVLLTLSMVLLFCGCGVMNLFEISDEIGQEKTATEEQDLPEESLSGTGKLAEEEELSATGELTEADPSEEPADSTQDMEKLYIGEYLDYDNGDPNLEIANGEDGKYIVQIGFFRLCTLDDGVGEFTEDGMTFTATDPAGNPIGGIITVEDGVAKVTFTDSTWEYLENGTSYEYIKSSETPDIWSE